MNEREQAVYNKTIELIQQAINQSQNRERITRMIDILDRRNIIVELEFETQTEE
jgi:hypothetical protein